MPHVLGIYNQCAEACESVSVVDKATSALMMVGVSVLSTGYLFILSSISVACITNSFVGLSASTVFGEKDVGVSRLVSLVNIRISLASALGMTASL